MAITRPAVVGVLGRETWCIRVQAQMRPCSCVQVDNATPTILSLEKSVIRGIRGSVVPSPCTRCSSSVGSPSVGVASKKTSDSRRSLEIPTWMFEPAACSRLRLTTVPIVGLRRLAGIEGVTASRRRGRTVTVCYKHSIVPCLLTGGADATVREPSTTLATDAVSSSRTRVRRFRRCRATSKRRRFDCWRGCSALQADQRLASEPGAGGAA